MKIFLDTAKFDEIKEAVELGLCDGVTTNPTLASQVEGSYTEILQKIAGIVTGPISAEVTAEQEPKMIEEAEYLSSLASNIIIKIPFGPKGVKVTRKLVERGIDVNMTLVFSPLQALMSAKAGASYISPFVGRLDDISSYGMDLVGDIITIIDNYGFQSQVIVASIRHPMHILQAALMGADIATVPYKVLMKAFKHPLTDIGIQRFLNDWRKTKKEL